MRSIRSILWQFLTLLRPYRNRVALALILSVATILSSIALMMTSAWLISTAALHLGITSLGLAPTAVRLFGISRAVLRYLERLTSHDVTFRLLAQLRVWFYERIEPQFPAQLSQYTSSDLMSRMVADIEELQNLYVRVIAPPVVAVIITLIVGLLLALFDIVVAIATVAFMILAGTALPLITWWIGEFSGKHIIEARASINSHLIDSIQGIPDSLAYGYSDIQLEILNQFNAALTHREQQAVRLDGLQNAFTTLMPNLAACIVLWVAIERVEGVFLATITLGILAAFEAITPLNLAAANLSKEITAARRIFEIMDASSNIEEPPTPQRIPESRFDLSLRGISFRYAPDESPVFKDFSLDITHGQKIAIMGESGSGKSSLVNMLLRFHDYASGQIRIGGIDLKDLAHEDIRNIFGVMTQRVHLFNTTIKENIRITHKEASDDAIIAAAQSAQIHDFIESLPDRYDTYVGEHGVNLSGGERQRIALARILLKDSPIWILDEITANLDPITANRVMQSVLSVAQGRTIILMTHDNNLILRHFFDRILEL